MKNEHYTPAQASVVTRLPLKAIHKLIDGRLIRPRRLRVGGSTQRMLTEEQLVYLKLEADGVRLLPLSTRRAVAKAVEASATKGTLSVSEGPALTIQVAAARQEVKQELMRLRKAKQMAVSDPEIMQGAPVYRGTRIPIELVAEMLSQGANIEEILEGYPALNREKVGLAPLYVSAFPRRGRPAIRPWAGKKPARATRSLRSLAG
ncbi:MAG: DUF433 domain-containing protein [Acidobacteriia bacterium]|nr:DUF433 domain-containing protein [Terriglobia bacterium]